MVKIERTFPAPASLEIESKKTSGSYSKPDVVERLKKDFHNKCYVDKTGLLSYTNKVIDTNNALTA